VDLGQSHSTAATGGALPPPPFRPIHETERIPPPLSILRSVIAENGQYPGMQPNQCASYQTPAHNYDRSYSNVANAIVKVNGEMNDIDEKNLYRIEGKTDQLTFNK